MDTRSTKFKYSFFSKGLCFILSAVLFFSFVYSGIIIIAGTQVIGFEEYLSGDYPSFTHSYGFESMFSADFYYTRILSDHAPSDIEAAFNENQNEIIENAVDTYLTEKAEIIKNELQYAVDNYDEAYFNYEYTADAVVIPQEQATSVMDIGQETTTTEILTDKNGNSIPRNIEAAQKILQTAQGKEFLDYEVLVRADAFTEGEFQYNTEVRISEYHTIGLNLYNNSGYDLDEQEIKKVFLEQYSSAKEDENGSVESNFVYAKSRLSKLDVFKYYVIDAKGTVYSNVEKDISKEAFVTAAESNSAYIIYDGKNIRLGDFAEDEKESYTTSLTNWPDREIYIYIDESRWGNTDDPYANLYSAYTELKTTDSLSLLGIAALTLIASFILMIVFLCLCGHKNGEEKPVTAYIDKLPTDIHFILSFGCIAGLTVLTIWLGAEIIASDFYTSLFLIFTPWILSAILTVSYMFFIEWLASTVRIKKAGKKFFKRMLIVRAFSAVCTGIQRFSGKLSEKFKYQPKKIKKTLFVLIGGYLSGNIVLCPLVALALGYFTPIPFILSLICFIAYNAVCLYFIIEYLKKLDTIIDASCRHIPADFGGQKVPESLRLLALNLTNTNEALEQAIAKAVRDEQMKTELITNVSHDLKTPLTSLISYSDLLEKCDIQDETAKKYIGVIHTQSIKLKRLIEDLIEASKVSSGNVTINATNLNFSELAMQAIAEFAPEMEKNGNEIIFLEPETAPLVFADGSKTYRILSNLLSNAKKYSAADTRVYVSVYSDNINSYFEIKNISCEQLNISPNELTERFVRGDKSRTREGNGLGLSIAKDLCVLQNGNLHLFIDGDLFKAIVQLPAVEKTPASPVNEDEDDSEN